MEALRALGFRLATIAVASVMGGACGSTADSPDAAIDGDVAADADAGADADGGGDAVLPPRICRTPGAPPEVWYTEITSDSGLARTDTLEPLGVNIVAADFDRDGWQDFYSAATSSHETAESKRMRFLFMNRPDPGDPTRRVFVDAIDGSGLLAMRGGGTDRRGMGPISAGDVDNDGDLDVVGCSGDISLAVQDPCSAMLNDGAAHFSFAPQEGDLESDIFSSVSSTMLDYDLDGVLDFWPGTIGRWQYGDAAVSRPRLYRGLGDGTFEEVGEAMGLPTSLSLPSDYRMNFGMTSCDVDLDGDRDVVIGQYGVPIGPNHLYRNDGDRFTDVARELGVRTGPAGEGGVTFCIACGDIDDDGDVDLMTAELHHAWYPDTDWTELLLNDTPVGDPLLPFRRPGREAMGIDKPHIGSRWTEGDAVAIFADVDLDGRKDIFVASVNYPQQSATDPDWTHDWLYRQKEDRTFEDVTDRTPWWDTNLQSLGTAALFDLDNDGDLDVVTGTGTYNSEYLHLTNAVHAFRNVIGQESNFIRVSAVGRGAGGANRSGIGARVEITVGDHTQQQEVLGSFANTQSDVLLTFGLGGACEIDRMVVHWPNAAHSTTTYEHVLANYLVEAHEDDAALVYRNLDGTAP